MDVEVVAHIARTFVADNYHTLDIVADIHMEEVLLEEVPLEMMYLQWVVVLEELVL